MNLSVFFG